MGMSLSLLPVCLGCNKGLDPRRQKFKWEMTCTLDNQGVTLTRLQFKSVANGMPFSDGQGVFPTLYVHLFENHVILNPS